MVKLAGTTNGAADLTTVIPNATTAAFWSSSVIRRQYDIFQKECECTRALHAEYAQRHQSLDRLIVIDGSKFRWEGLGNSGTRWMGLLRWGYATGRAVFLKIAKDETRMDIGDYFVGYGGVDWNWASQRAAIRRKLYARGVRPVVLEYGCAKRAPPGCGIARLRHPRNRSVVAELAEPKELIEWMRSSSSPPWIKLVLNQQDSIEHSYGRPEALRTVLPLTSCPIPTAKNFRDREKCLKCETFSFMQPRPHMIQALVPLLKRLETYDYLVGVHLRTGYADWAFRNDDTFFPSKGSKNAVAAPPTKWTLSEHWQMLDRYFNDCQSGQLGPCFNWVAPRKGVPPTRDDALRCGLESKKWRNRAGGPGQLWTDLEGAPQGFLASMLLCAARLGQAMALSSQHQDGAAKRWGILVLSDSPAFPSLATHLPALRDRAVHTAGTGAGQLGHSSFSRSCSMKTGCAKGRDPGGTWTRSLVDFYLAGVANGFVKGLFTSFLYSTMRRDVLCCEPGAFVQWLGWYNLSRSHRDLPMKDRGFLEALTRAE